MARNFAKNPWTIMKLDLDLQVMVTDLHAKKQVNIWKHLEKNSGKLFDCGTYKVQSPQFHQKLNGA